MGMAFADCRVAHNWVFVSVFHNLIRQSHRGKPQNFHCMFTMMFILKVCQCNLNISINLFHFSLTRFSTLVE